MKHFQYLLLIAGCAAITLPLESVFRARVYRRPVDLLVALAPPVLVFLAWDAIAIERHHWKFGRKFITGWRLPFGIPIEDVAFLVALPICALLAFETCRRLLEPQQQTEDAKP